MSGHLRLEFEAFSESDTISKPLHLCHPLGLLPADDEQIRYDDCHASGVPQVLEHQNMAGPHRSMGLHFQHRYKHKTLPCALRHEYVHTAPTLVSLRYCFSSTLP